ncbi:MAG: hypothetical protein ACE5HE_09950 [Phycisphaerae bacterium]
MVARFAGAGLGFLAFTVTALAGLFIQNPVNVTLSRSILALFLFSFIGLAVGAAAQLVVREYERDRAAEIRRKYQQGPATPNDADPGRTQDEQSESSMDT